MSFHYRFSVIPAGAITDDRLTPRALQVLCLLGRHTNDNGWCSRSQVKMAAELRCSRSAVYDAIELLHESGWIERARNGRGGTPAEASEQPFAAYSYRVLLDRGEMPKRLAVAPPDAEGGAAQAAGGAAIAAGGAAPGAAPLEETPLKGIPAEPERENARARDEEDGPSLATFEARWPTAAQDSRAKTAAAWRELTAAERKAALASIDAFLADLKRQKRTTVPAGSTYLAERRWTLLSAASPPAGHTVVQAWSREWWAAMFARCDRGEPIAFPLKHAIERGGPWGVRCTEMPPDEVVAALKSYPSDGHAVAAWRPWFAARRAPLPDWRQRMWVFLPSPEPPPAGTPVLAGRGSEHAA